MAGNEETTVKPITRKFSNYLASVPIKKRRFPLVQPSSPQSEERSTSPKDGNSVHAEKDSNISNAHCRANWDLNTTMDSWADRECEAPAMELPVSLQSNRENWDLNNPLTYPRGKTQTCIAFETTAAKLPVTETSTSRIGITSHRQAPLNSELGTDLVAASEQLKDSLHLSLGSSFPTHFSHISCKSSATILDSRSYDSNLRSPGIVEKLDIPNMAVSIVKSELSEESVKINCESDGLTVNCQPGERYKVELPKICENIMEEKLVNATKTKPVEECNMDSDSIKQEGIDQDTVTAAKNTEDPAVLRIKLIDKYPHDFHQSRDGSISDYEKINIFTDILEEDSYYESGVNQAVPMAVEVEDDGDDDDYEDGEVREPVANSKAKGPECDGKAKEDVGNFEFDDNKMNIGDPGEASNGDCKDYKVSIAMKSADVENEEFPFLESMVVEEKIAKADVKRPTEATHRRLDRYDQSGKKKTLIGKETSAHQAPGLVSEVTVVHSVVDDVKNVDLVQKIELVSTKVEASVNSDDVAKDACGGGGSGMSRIIKLPRGSSSSLPGKTRSFSDRPFPLPPGRERIADIALESRRLHSRRRDGFCIDGSQNFSRERNHDRSPRSSRRNVLQDRRKFDHLGDRLHGDWDCEGDFGTNVYSSPSDRGMNRNSCTSRRGWEDGSDMAEERRNAELIRGFRDNSMDSMFTRAQPPFEGVDGHFVRRNRSFSSIQRDLSGVRTESPIRSRSRSPGSWLSPRRSTMYSVERVRSPDRSCFRGELAVRRRHGSPPFVSTYNHIRDGGSGHDNGHLRSAVPGRSSSGKVLARNRRLDVMDHRERADNDEYFDRLDHSAQFEFNEDRNGVERRRFGDRRPVHSFRPQGGREDDNFHDGEDSSRPFRCFSEDVEFRDRGSVRERDFGRRMKNRPGNLSRQMSSMDEEEDSYRTRKFIPRMKTKRD